MFGLSTYHLNNSDSARELDATLSLIGTSILEGVSLFCSVPQLDLVKLARPFLASGIALFALDGQHSGPSFPLPRLCSLEKEEHDSAVRGYLQTISRAGSLEVRKVTVRLGFVDADPAGEAHRILYRQTPGDALREEKLWRLRHFDSALRGLEKLVTEAERRLVTLGVENGPLSKSLPDPGELERLLSLFRGAPVEFWFNPRHALLLSTEAGVPMAEFQPGDRPLAGVHLYDAGKEPFGEKGEAEQLDWPGMLRELPKEIPRIIQVPPGTDLQSLRPGLERLGSL